MHLLWLLINTTTKFFFTPKVDLVQYTFLGILSRGSLLSKVLLSDSFNDISVEDENARKKLIRNTSVRNPDIFHCKAKVCNYMLVKGFIILELTA